MASHSFEVEDQLDEDFFDKLVNDDDDFDFTGSTRNLVVEAATDSEEVKAFSNLTITETTPARADSGGKDVDFGLEAEMGIEDGGNSALLVATEDNVVANESSSVLPNNVLDSTSSTSDVGKDVFSNLTITETSSAGDDSGGKDVDFGLEVERGEDGGNSVLLDANEDNVVANKSSLVPCNVEEFSEMGTGEEGVLDRTTTTGDVGKDVISNLTITETSSAGGHSGGKDVDFGLEAERGVEDGANYALLDSNEDNVVANEISSVVPSNVKEFSGMGKREEGVLDSTTTTSDVALSAGVKEVQWSSFNSDTNVQSSGGLEFFNDLGVYSEDPFAELGNDYDSVMEFNATGSVLENSASYLASSSYLQNSEVQYLENQHPGSNTGQWYRVEGYDGNTTMNSQESFGVTHSNNSNLVSNKEIDTHSLQQTTQSVVGTIPEDFGNSYASNWNYISQGNAEYPAHMVFDPRYPDYYYDENDGEWKMLNSYTPAVDQSATIDYDQKYQNKNIESYESEAFGSQYLVMNKGESSSNYHQQNSYSFQAYSVSQSVTDVSSETKQQLGNIYGSADHIDSLAEQQNGFESYESVAPYYEQPSQSFLHGDELSRFQSFVPAQSYTQFNNQTTIQSDQQVQFIPAFIDAQKSGNYPQQPLQIGPSFSSSAIEGRSSSGRPPHALVTFGFGGKLLVMGNNSFSHTTTAYGNQGSVGGVVTVLNLMEVVMDSSKSFGFGAHDYFQTLCEQSLPGPLVGGSVGNKELYKWIDEKIVNCESSSMGYRGEVFRLLFSLLKISCQNYGKLRSPFGTDLTLKESDYPELAIAKLLGSVKGKGVESSAHVAVKQCLQNLPSEAQMQATALEVQRLLVSGRKKEALEYAQEGQLWGPALVIASQLGDQFYGDTVNLMALKQLIAGSPLRTLCLVVAGRPADVFSTVSPSSNLTGYVNTPNQPGEIGANMLDGWEENLAIITANRTKDDELVIIHLGDCLWKERGEAAAAHICYLVAEANFEPYSDGARLCLIGADHWNCPRTYVSPEAIQRTELYEYSKVLGNSQFLLLPFQPYKLIYAYMLAEVGKIADSLKYCQAILKSLKTGRTPEMESWKQLVSSLEERLRIHQQGGYENLAPTKLVGKLLTFFDNTAHRVVGGPPPALPSTSHSNVQQNMFAHQPGGLKPSNSQQTTVVQSLTSSATIESAMAMPSLIPSASMEPISEWTAQTNLSDIPNRSISEPDFGLSDRKVNSSNEAKTSGTQEKAAVSSGSSRFGRFGSQLFQKTVGLVLKSRPDRQAKLGEKNKFYYDEKLKRWVEEGAEPPAEEAALPPPPPTAAFPNGMNDLSITDKPKTESLHTSSDNESPISSERISGIPPIPPSSNQYSARARMGVRSRYVDTFNKSGGSPVSLFQSPPIPSAKPVAGSSPKFFIPSPVTPTEEMAAQNSGESMQEAVTNETPVSSSKQDLSQLPSASVPLSLPLATMQRFHSIDTIVAQRAAAVSDGNSRRTASWSGSLNDAGIKLPRETLGTSSSFYAEPNSGGDLHEI